MSAGKGIENPHANMKLADESGWWWCANDDLVLAGMNKVDQVGRPGR